MKGPIVEHQHVKRRGKGLGEVVQPQLKHGAIQEGQFQKKAVTCRRFHGSKEIEIVDALPHRRHGLDSTRRNPAADDGLEAQARFILGKDLDPVSSQIAGERLGEQRRQGSRECLQRFWAFFSWDGRGRFGFARSAPRTKA
jgi:hypothetical protein